MFKNLRPITLLNSDYKIIEKAIANKMLPALEHIIHTDQRGFMKNRRISVNIRKMLDIIHQANKEDLEAVVLSLDFVKCFDKCSFSILHGSLDFFEFGQIIKDWTKILYNDFTVKIQNNGFFSEQIPIKKGVHQGGCCSSVYFLVIAEILALALRNNEDIEGITFGDIRNLLNQFADDMDVFSRCTEKSVKAIFSELEQFRHQSGFTLSYEKTTLYRIGSLRFSDAQMYNLSEVAWSNQDINVLGVTIAHSDIVQKNYRTMVDKVRTILNAWYNRGLSLLGKIQVVNTLVASLFVYKMMVLPTIPDSVVKSLDNLIREFIWDGKKSKIAYNILQGPKELGGQKLVSLKLKDKALKATWPQILASEPEYAKLVYTIIRCTGIGDDIWRCRLNEKDIRGMKISSEFWRDVLVAWNSFNIHHDYRIENQLVWYNSDIRIKNKPVFWEDCYKKGLKYVAQLFENQQYKSDKEVWDEFGLTKLRYNSIKAAMPADYKNYFVNNPVMAYTPVSPSNFDKYMYTGNLSSIVYKQAISDPTLVQDKHVKWGKDLGQDFSVNLQEFHKSFRDIYKLTNVSKYRSFQYRLMQRGLITNIQLCKWGIKSSDQCNLCKSAIESLTHLFVECDRVQVLWRETEQYIARRFKCQDMSFCAYNVLFDCIVPNKKHVANFICLLTKQFIYRQRCLDGNTSFVALKREIEKVENIEKYIAIKNNKLSVHIKKWYS